MLLTVLSCFVLFAVLRMEPRTSHRPGSCSPDSVCILMSQTYRSFHGNSDRVGQGLTIFFVRVSLYNQLVFDLVVLLSQLLVCLDYRWALLGHQIQPVNLKVS